MNTKPKIRVLIADDNQLFREGLVSLLQREPDIEVVATASDGTEVLPLAQKHHPDVVLMDIQMPRCNGLEATQRLMAWDPTLKIVMLTVSDKERDLFEAIKWGARGYLLKMSTGARELVETVRRVAAGEAIITPALVPYLLDQFAALARNANQAKSHENAPAQGGGEESPLAGEKGGAPTVDVHTTSIDILTEREREVLNLVAEGLTNREIAERLVVSENTVRAHLRNILDKLHVQNRIQAALLYRQWQQQP